eukprot:101399_1
MIEKKFGKNSKSGDALQNIIDVSRNRHSFFAQLLVKSMKGMGTDDDLLIRTIVGRSAIDLGQISSEFSSKFGSGKTLLQFIKGDTRKGTYRNIILKICAIGQIDDIDDDAEEKVLDTYPNGNDANGDDEKLQEPLPSSPTIKMKNGFNASSVAKELISVMEIKKKKKKKEKKRKKKKNCARAHMCVCVCVRVCVGE